ncbi:MAG: DUF1631 domain-containing protein [Pseudomonadota bacterium]|nr:DUF1631 domain-containing protein [Pseudomonadota bacterium]
MSATATLHNANSDSAGIGASPKAAVNPIVTALHQMAVSVLGEKLREMFDKADDILFDSAEKARAGDEQRLYMDTMRIVRVQRSKIIKAFEDALKHSLEGIKAGAVDPDLSKLDDMSQWSLQDGDALEERIAVSNMQTKASSLHAHELVELQRRLARLSDLAGADGLSPESMSPTRIIRAFQDSMRDLAVEFPIKLVIYKLFDRVVVGRLSEVFVGANQLLAVHGIEPSSAAPATARKSVLPHAPHQVGVPSWAMGLDNRSMQAFLPPSGYAAGAAGSAGSYEMPTWAAGRQMPWGQGHGQSMTAGSAAATGMYAGPQTTQQGDEQIAHEIAHILGDYAQGRMPQRQDWIPPENVALVARMFDGYYRDSRLSDELKPLLARLQVPATKAALADQRFFADPQHPTRRTINDLFEMLLQFGTADAPPPQLLNEVQGLVDAAAQAFHLDPAKLKAARPPTVDERTADDFLLEQQNQQQRKNRSRIERVRRIVSHELRRRIGERPMAQGIMRLMLSGFGPLLCLDYIRSGIEGASWNQTMELVDRVLASLDRRSGSADVCAAEEAEIVASISRRLTGIGFSDERLEEVISGLLQAYLEKAEAPFFDARNSDALSASTVEAEAGASIASTAAVVDARPVLSPAQDLQGLLSILLIPGGWYTVLDPAAGIKHWVRVRGYYPQQNAVMLSHYMEDRYLRVRATAFATDLIESRVMPIDPSSDLQGAIARLTNIEFERGSDLLIWTGPDGKPVDTGAVTQH